MALPTIMEDAIQSGLVGNSSVASQVSGVCPSANCTWDPYVSLAFCSNVEDVTPTISKNCGTTYLRGFDAPTKNCNVTTEELMAGALAYTPPFLTTPSLNWLQSTVGVFSSLRLFYPNTTWKYPPLLNDSLHNFTLLDIFLIYTAGEGEWDYISDAPAFAEPHALKATINLCFQTLQTTMANATTVTVVQDTPNDVRWTGYGLPDDPLGVTFGSQSAGGLLNYTVDFSSLWTTANFLQGTVFNATGSMSSIGEGWVLVPGDGTEVYDLAHEPQNGSEYSTILTSLGTAIWGPELSTFNESTFDPTLALEGFTSRMNNLTTSMTNACVVLRSIT